MGRQQKLEKKETATPDLTLESTVEIPAVVTAAADGALETSHISPRKQYRKGMRDVFQVLFFIFQFGLDTTMISLGFLAAYFLRARVPLGGVFIPFSPQNYPIILGISVIAVIVSFYVRKLYSLKRGYSKIDEFYRICAATTLGLILAIAVNSVVLGPSLQYSRQILLYALVLIILFTALARLIFGALVGLLRKTGATRMKLLLVGSSDATQRILRKVNAAPELGYSIVGVISDGSASLDIELKLPILGNVEQLRQIVEQYEVDEIIITLSGASQDSLLELVDQCEDLPVNIKIYPDAFQLITTSDGAIGELTGLPLVSVKNTSLRGVNRAVKRIMDVVISGCFLIVVSPLMLLLGILIKITEPKSPIMFTQERVGLDGKPFTVLKFRSMRSSSEERGPGWTVKNDPRRTHLGTFMRRYSLDEIPQFINVLLGDMSIVGPRPEQIKMVEEFSRTYPRYMRRHREKAGITGWAQVNGLRGDTSIEERIRYDLYYVENWSVLFDLKIILKTLIVIFTDKNAY